MRRVLVWLLLVCAACATPPVSGQVASTPESVWSAPMTLAQTQQADAPALVVSGDALLAAWVGSDARGVHQDARRLTADSSGDVITLPLPPTHPYGQQLIAGDSGQAYLLWLDAGENDQTNLYSALLAPDLTVERGQISVSEGLALTYSAVPDGEGGLWVVWSGGLLAEMTIYVRRIDNEGRPQLEKNALVNNADDPALVRTAAGEVWLFWLANGQLYRQRLDPAGDAQALTSAISLAPGDRLVNVRAALDTSNAYFFWNVTRANGTDETWMTSGALSADVWRAPQPMRAETNRQLVITNLVYPLGEVPVTLPGNSLQFRWLEPLSGQPNMLAAATETDEGLGVVFISGNGLVGYTTAVPGVKLIGMPALVANTNNDLFLAWSAPGDTMAALQLITTRK